MKTLENTNDYDEFFTSITSNLRETKNLYLITIPIILMGIYATYVFFADFSITNLLLALAGYFVFNVVGITAGFHRYFTHKSFKVGKWRERLMLWAGTLAGQGPVVFWVAIHRGYHHRFSDTTKDPHSPIYGFWHSFILWMFKLKSNSINLKYSFELLKNKEAMWLTKNYTTVVLATYIIAALISWELFLFFFILPIFVTMITYNITNSLCHTPKLGYSNYAEWRDNSTNVPWAWPFVLGECWHNNHHARPGDYSFSKKWWEIDPSGIFIKFFKDKDE